MLRDGAEENLEVQHEQEDGFRERALLLNDQANGGRGYPSETRVKRGVRVVHGDKVLDEKLGRNDLCPCGSGRRFQEVLHGHRRI